MSCADFCFSGGFDDGADVADVTIRRARKSHRCEECRETIAVGQSYEHTSMLYEGTWERYRTCLPCAEIRNALSCDGSWVWGQLWRNAADVTFPAFQRASPIDCLAKIESLAARDKLRAKFAEWEQQHPREVDE